MKKNYFLTVLSLLFCFALQAQVSYSGSNSGFGGTLGGGSLNVSDNGTDVTFDFTLGAVNSNVIVVYIDSKSGGFTDTSTLTDDSDGGRSAVSTKNGTNNPTVTFPSGFTADYAIAMGSSWAALFELSTGSHSATGLTFSSNSTSVTFAQLGTTAVKNFSFVSTLNSETSYLSNEVIGDTSSIVADGGGTNPGNTGSITFSGDRSYPNTWTGTTDSDWATATNWTEGTPTATHNVYIPMVTNQPTAAGAVTINKGVIKSGASLLTQSTFAGTINYNVHVNDTNWHLLSSPVEGEGYDAAWVDANLIDNTTDSGTNVGIATYINTSDADGDWTYVADAGSGTFNTAQGYSIKRDATTSDISFIGTVKTDGASPAITANDIGGGNENRWTLIGNPFPSYISVTSLLGLAANSTALEDSREAVYVWDNNKAGGAGYSAITTGYIHPGQGFFVNSNVASTSIAINQDMLSHQSGITFYKNNDTSINLMITDGLNTKSTEINYIANKTKGLDPRFDIGTFTGTTHSFEIYTHLVNNNNGVNFMRQALPSSEIEAMVVPVGIKAAANTEITITAEALNLPTGIKVFLEDKLTNTFTRLDEANSEFKITLTDAVNGVGRFYLYTTQSALNIKDVVLNGVNIFKSDASTIRISGLPQGKASVSLFNILGKQVMTTSFEAKGIKDVSLPKLATGVYFAKVQTETGKVSKKIILE